MRAGGGESTPFKRVYGNVTMAKSKRHLARMEKEEASQSS